ncbi:MAG TPA: DNA methyltransferase [Polyangia bacterium]
MPRSLANRLRPEDRPAHDWYRFVLSYPPHLVRDYLARFGVGAGGAVLDPFCGTGTTLVECKRLGVASVGFEANPMAAFAAEVKTDWTPAPAALAAAAERVAATAERLAAAPALRALPDEAAALLLRGSISPRPLHRALGLLAAIREQAAAGLARHAELALARVLVAGIGNLHFGPEVGVGPAKEDAPAVELWRAAALAMAADLEALAPGAATPARVHRADARDVAALLAPESLDAVITSPPYPNEKDYTRTTRLESVILGFVSTRAELRALKQGLVRSNTRGVYAADTDDQLVAGHPVIARVADEIEARRVALGKTSGFERLYARVTRLYFGGMARHLAALRPALRPGARLAYVVGDQASYLRVMIRTGQLLASLADGLGYEVEGIDLFRTRLATATREQLREEVVVLRWPGPR